MSSKRKREVPEYTRTISEQQFKQEFKELFDLDSELTAEACYMILAGTNFDLEKTNEIIIQGCKPVKQYTLPASLFRSSSISSTAKLGSPSPILTPTSSQLGTPPSSFEAPVEDSDDDPEEPPLKRRELFRICREDERQGGTDTGSEYISHANSEEEEDSAENSEEENPVDNLACPASTRNRATSHRAPASRRKNLDDAVLQHRSTTKVTPWLYKLASNFYGKKLEEIEDNGSTLPNRQDPVAFLEDLKELAFQKDPESIKFNSPVIWKESGRKFYASVEIDSISYRPGDYVLVRGDVSPEGRQKRSSKQKDPLSPSFKTSIEDIWFARIKYLIEDDYGEKMAHFQWFEHGSRTALGELANCNELFLLTWCDENTLACVLQKIHVDCLVEENFGLAEYNIARGRFFYRLHYDPGTCQFTEASLHERAPTDEEHPRTCSSCDIKEEKSREGEVRLLGKVGNQGPEQFVKGVAFKGFSFNKIKYFLHDFVYVVDTEEENPYTICQITSISTKDESRRYKTPGATIKSKKLKIKVDTFERYDTLYNSTWFDEATIGINHAVRDQRRLYRTGKSIKITVEDLEGKCHVRHVNDIEDLDAYKNNRNAFWLKDEVKSGIDPYGVIRRQDLCLLSSDGIQYSEQSEKDAAVKKEMVANYLENGTVLRTMEIFAGAGGMTAGLIAAFKGSLDFVSAVEFSPAACHTHSINFPNCQVHCADASVLLERAIRRERGEKLDPLVIDGKIVPDLPRPGEIDFICGGPPCPGFSRMNRFKTSDDIKNSLIVLSLAYLDFYKPKYFLLENVAELLHNRLGATQIGMNNLEGGIGQGTVKLILRACTGLGYQVQSAILQAAEHNVPQSRKRVFFWASQPGWPLPKYPEVENLVRATRESTRNRWQNGRRSAPQNMVTVGDAISDLPAFEWKNPYGDYPSYSRLEREQRWDPIEQYEVGESFVGRDTQSYASPPLSEFQRNLRKDVAMTGLTNHVNEIVSPEQIRRVNAVPLRPGSDHRDIPEEIKQPFLCKKNKNAARHNFYAGRYGRLDMEKIFRTCVTTLDPSKKPGMVLHPTQHRVITIREFARAMSFPDSFRFDLESCRMKDIIRQIGNGVPTNLAKAVGEQLFEVMVEKHRREKNA